jgi:spore coat polysaccharide biosynthesis predicted glycosyltransferase SpsG
MKLYYYAHTGHKIGLDRVKKAVVILKKLEESGIETVLLVNDFRAGLVAREYGVFGAITIEGIQDIDAIAETGDSVIIDSPEDDHGRLVKYMSDFEKVFRFATSDEDRSIHGEIMLEIECMDEACLSSIIVNDIYFNKHKKEERTLFFLGDSDANKIILSNSDFFKELGMELLLGNYFYVKYEDDLAKLFTVLHEPEEYVELICSSSRVVTASFQTALEAKVVGAEAIYIELVKLSKKEKKILSSNKIVIISNFDVNIYKQNIISIVSTPCNNIEKSNKVVEKIVKEL